MINRAVDAARRTVEVWCEIANPPSTLRSGLFGTVDIVTSTAAASVVAPLAAIQFVEGTRNGIAMVVDDKRKAHKREVECGTTYEGKVQILKGLTAGETVIVEAGYGLPDGADVQLAGENKK
jgi:multidrug efflux pump subunit AcrA (membrane-fusion protein)